MDYTHYEEQWATVSGRVKHVEKWFHVYDEVMYVRFVRHQKDDFEIVHFLVTLPAWKFQDLYLYWASVLRLFIEH